jgi:hypothetical protein
MHKNVTKCNETLSKWCKNKHRASKIIDMFEMYQGLAPNHSSYSVISTDLYGALFKVNAVVSNA